MLLGRITFIVALVSLALALVWFGGCSEKSTGGPERDTFPPDLVSAVAVDEIHVNATFNEKLDETSAEDATNYTIIPTIITSGSTVLLPVVSAVLLEDGMNVLLETGPQLGLIYSLQVSGVKDLAGNTIGEESTNFNGSTQADTTAPEVISTIPADAARDVDTLTTVTVEFNERMNTTSVESSFYLESANDPGPSVPGSFSWEANNTRAVFTPTHPLEDLTLYDAWVDTGATDASGNPLESEYSWSFVTGNGGAISGTISYHPFSPQGASQVVGPVWIALFDEPCFYSPVMSKWVDELGAYTFDPVPPGTYYLVAIMDVNGNQEEDLGEPVGMYDTGLDSIPDPIVVVEGVSTSGVDVSLDFEFRYCTISGTVTKAPDVTESDTTYVFFFLQDPTVEDEVELSGLAIVPDGTGTYTSTPLWFGCYYIICFMDLNGNEDLDFLGGVPAEPVGWYGEQSPGFEPVITPIWTLRDIVGIDMELMNFASSTVPPVSVSRLRDIMSSRRGEGGLSLRR
jgi:uncharacterized protein (DUF2141 family)